MPFSNHQADHHKTILCFHHNAFILIFISIIAYHAVFGILFFSLSGSTAMNQISPSKI